MNNKQHMHSIGRRFRKARILMGYSREDVRQVLGLQSTSHISDWERGVRLPGIPNLLKLSVLYKTLPDTLLHELRQEAIKDVEEWMKKNRSKY